MHVRDMPVQGSGMRPLTETHVVHGAVARHGAGNLRRQFRAHTARQSVIARQFQCNDETSTTGGTNSLNGVIEKTQASVEIAAISVFAEVTPWREELMEQVTMAGRQFNTRETAALEARCGLREVFHHALQLVSTQHMRHGPGKVIRQRRHTNGSGVTSTLVPTSPGVLHLPEQTAVLTLDRCGPALQAFEIIVVPDTNLVRRLLQAGHVEWLTHYQRRTTTGPIGVVLHHAGRHALVHHPTGGHRGMQDSVA